MIERVEVLAGEGTVIRYGEMVAWAAPTASPSLISFLAQSARNLSVSDRGGLQMAEHIAGVLRERDPEPHVAFAVLGPDGDGWTSLLHGPVQVWDGNRWLAPTPSPGWMHDSVDPRPAVAVNRAGSAVPPPDPNGLWDLEGGVVRGGGFVLVPGHSSHGATTSDHRNGQHATAGVSGVVAGIDDDPGDETGVLEVPEPTTVVAASPPTAVIEVVGADPAGEGSDAQAGSEPLAPEPSPPAPQLGVTRFAGPPGSIDLAHLPLAAPGVIPNPTAPLPIGAGPDRPVPGAPVVAGVRCERGHLNRPGPGPCVRCGSALPDDATYTVSGTRPGLGCLVADDGSIWRMDTAYLVGSEPTGDPTVSGGMARALRLDGADVSPSHADLRIRDWDVQVIDRAAPSGTWVFEPASKAWERLTPYEARTLKPGTHVAFGQRIVTFVTPWVEDQGR